MDDNDGKKKNTQATSKKRKNTRGREDGTSGVVADKGAKHKSTQGEIFVGNVNNIHGHHSIVSLLASTNSVYIRLPCPPADYLWGTLVSVTSAAAHDGGRALARPPEADGDAYWRVL